MSSPNGRRASYIYLFYSSALSHEMLANVPCSAQAHQPFFLLRSFDFNYFSCGEAQNAPTDTSVAKVHSKLGVGCTGGGSAQLAPMRASIPFHVESSRIDINIRIETNIPHRHAYFHTHARARPSPRHARTCCPVRPLRCTTNVHLGDLLYV